MGGSRSFTLDAEHVDESGSGPYLDTPRFERWLRGEALLRLIERRIRKLAPLGETSTTREESSA